LPSKPRLYILHLKYPTETPLLGHSYLNRPILAEKGGRSVIHSLRQQLNARVATLLSFSIVMAFLGGCAVAAPGASAPEASAKVKVVYWAHDFQPRAALDQKFIADFMAANPNIEVEYDTTGEYDTKLRTALAAGTGPDLFAQWNGEIGQFYLSGAIAPVDPTAMGLDSEKDISDQYVSPETILSGAMFEGKLYGIPNEVSTYACFLNNKLWQEAGLDPAADFPANWEDFPTVMEKLTKRDNAGNILQRGFDFNWSGPDFKFETLVSMAEQLGAKPIDEENYVADLQSPEVVRVLQFLTDYVNKDNLGGPGYQGSRDGFQAGELATECSFGSWGIPGMKEAGIDYTIHKLPTFRDASSPNYFDTYAYFHMVNAHSAPEVQQAAWKLAYFLSQHGEDYLTSAGLLQPKKELVESQAFTSDPNLPLFLDEMQSNFYLPRIAGFWEVNEAVARAMDRSILEKVPVEESLATAQTEVNEILTRAHAAATGSQ